MNPLSPRWSVVLALLLFVGGCGDDPVPTVPVEEDAARAPASTAPETADTVAEVEVPSWAKVAPEQIAEAKKHGVPVAFENALGMQFVLIPAGTFLMGSPEDEAWRQEDETQHEVTIPTPFYMSIYEVTNGQFLHFQPAYKPASYYMRHEARMPRAEREPAVVPWQHVQGFAVWLGREGRVYRIPTEEEWEYACRAGTRTRFWWGDSESEAGRYANVWDKGHHDLGNLPQPEGWGPFDTKDGHSNIAPVGSYPPNRWGLRDMAGNVAEWCRWSTRIEPDSLARMAWPLVVRGGWWRANRAWTRSASRTPGPWNEARPPRFGFRLVSPLPEPGRR